MKVESAARSAALMTASSANPVDPKRRPLDEEDDDTGEIPFEARSIVHRFPSLPKEDTIRIFRNKFRPINLFRLRHVGGIRHRHVGGIRHDALQDQDRIGLDKWSTKATASYWFIQGHREHNI